MVQIQSKSLLGLFLIFCKVAQRLKCLPPMRETWVRSLGREDPLEKEMAIHSSILAWRIPWTEKPSRLQSTGSQRVRHDWATSPHYKKVSVWYWLTWCSRMILFLGVIRNEIQAGNLWVGVGVRVRVVWGSWQDLERRCLIGSRGSGDRVQMGRLGLGEDLGNYASKQPWSSKSGFWTWSEDRREVRGSQVLV